MFKWKVITKTGIVLKERKFVYQTVALDEIWGLSLHIQNKGRFNTMGRGWLSCTKGKKDVQLAARDVYKRQDL